MDHDVLIAGGGPVGMGLAIELGLRGIRVGVIERHERPQPIPKGQNLTQRTMEHMRRWGIEDAIRAAKTIPRGVGLGGLTAYGSLLGGYHYDWYKRAAVHAYYYAENERLPQYRTEQVLRARAGAIDGVDVRYGWSLTGLDQDADGVTAALANAEGETARLRAPFLVGCDGSGSTTRRAAAIGETRRDHDRLMALVVFRSPEFFDLVARFPDKQFYNVLHPDLDGYWMFFGMAEWGQTAFFHAPVPADTNRDNFDFAAYLHRAVGKEFALELDYVGFWELRIALADRYRAGRVFIAGDAAHSHPPYGGYGINTGLEDARNLGWKLAAHLKGWGGQALLDSYQAERRPVFASTATDFIERFIEEDRAFLRRYDPNTDRARFEAAWRERGACSATLGVSTYAPHYAGSPVVQAVAGATPSAVGTHDFAARPGCHLPPQRLGNGTTVDACLGAGFTFIDLAGEPAPDTLLDEAARLGIPLTIVSEPSPEARQAYGCQAILVRPDDFIAWTGDDAVGCAAQLARFVGRRSLRRHG